MKTKTTKRKPAARADSLQQVVQVRLLESDDDKEADIEMPFPPYPGLWVQIPWRGGDFAKLVDVYWYSDLQRFDAFIESPDDEELST